MRQGDLFSPLMFNMEGDCLAKMVLNAQAGYLFTGLADNLFVKGIAILEYADDTILFIKYDVEVPGI